MSQLNRFDMYVHDGDAFAAKGEWESAIAQYLLALEITETAKEVHEKLIKMYLNKRDRKGYMDALARFNAIKSGRPPARAKIPPLVKEPPSRPAERAVEPPKEVIPKEVTRPEFRLPEREPPFVRREPPIIEKERPVVERAHPPIEAERRERPAIQPEPPVAPRERPAIEQQRPAAPRPPSRPEPPPQPIRDPFVPKTTPAPQAAQPVSPPEALEVDEATTMEKTGDRLSKEGKKEEAIAAYERAATAFSAKGNKQKEAGILEKIVALDPENLDILHRLNEFYSKGIQLKNSTVLEIYRRIYHMKI